MGSKELFSSVYGLRLCINVPVAGLIPEKASSSWDVQIELGSVPNWLQDLRLVEPDSEPWHLKQDRSDLPPSWIIWKIVGDQFFRLVFQDGTEFLIDKTGKRVWATWPAPWTQEDTVGYLLGPVMGFLLALRGIICLHSSAVCFHNQVLCFVGPSGIGKSTTAAALSQFGCTVLADDIVPLRESANSHYFLSPGYPRLRLWPESVNILYGQPEALPAMSPNWNKRYADTSTPGFVFEPDAKPLGIIYLVEEAEPDSMPRIESISPTEAHGSLLGQRYFPMPTKTALKDAFQTIANVIRTVPTRKLRVTADSKHLPFLCRLLLEESERLLFGTR